MSDRGSSWKRLLVIYTAVGFIEVVFWSQLQAFTPLYLPRLGITEPNDIKFWTGALVAISTAIGLPFLPLWGALADRFSRQPLIVRSFVLYLVAGVICAAAGNIWVFLLGRTLLSLALGNTGLMMTTLSERVPARRLGLAFSIMNGAGPFGSFAGPLIGGPVVDAWGLPTLLAINVVLMVGAVAALAFGYRDTFKGTGKGSVLGMAAESVVLIWRSRRLRRLFPALFMLFSGWMLAFAYVPIAIDALYTGSEPGSATGYVIGAGGLTTLVLSPILGWLGDRFGHWRVLFAGAAVTVLLWPLPALAPDLPAFAVAWAAVAGTMSALFALSFSVLSMSAPSEIRGRVMTFSYLPVNLGYAIGPAVGSVVAQASVFYVFPAAAVTTALGIALLLGASRAPRHPAGA